MEKKCLMKEMADAASVLRGSKFKNLTKIEQNIESIKEQTGLETLEEVATLTALLDCQCSGHRSSVNELTEYFKCSSIEAMLLIPAIKSLIAKGFVKSEEGRRYNKEVKLSLYQNIYNAIVEGNELKPIPEAEKQDIDPGIFCDNVVDIVVTNNNMGVKTRDILALVERYEDETENLELIQKLKKDIPDIESRTLLYEVFYSFKGDFGGCVPYINEIMKSLYFNNIVEGARVKKRILEGKDPLIEKGYIVVGEMDGFVLKKSIEERRDYRKHAEGDVPLSLTAKGLRLFLDDAADAFVTKLSCEDRYEFISKIEEFPVVEPRYGQRFVSSNTKKDAIKNIQAIENANHNISAVKNSINKIKNIEDRLLFYKLCASTINSEVFRVKDLKDLFPTGQITSLKKDLKEKHHFLQKSGLIELKELNYIDFSEIVLTEKGKKLFFEEDAEMYGEVISTKGMLESEKIPEKNLYFEPTLEEQLKILRESLMEKNYRAMCERLKEKNMPSGVAVLFYGHPGTGKTESVMQIARETGRSVVHVDISSTKTCWFGESEKLIKAVFDDYRKLCEKRKIKPILLFNEADAIFSKRKDPNSGSCAQTENAIQNIILEEIERLDGILIATTNMAENLDCAFERRFLFKVHFDKPSTKSKIAIWMDKMPSLSEDEAMQLASIYDFSGGEIDNIVRKVTMEEVIRGINPDLERLKIICGEEKSLTKGSSSIGF